MLTFYVCFFYWFFLSACFDCVLFSKIKSFDLGLSFVCLVFYSFFLGFSKRNRIVQIFSLGGSFSTF